MNITNGTNYHDFDDYIGSAEPAEEELFQLDDVKAYVAGDAPSLMSDSECDLDCENDSLVTLSPKFGAEHGSSRSWVYDAPSPRLHSMVTLDSIDHFLLDNNFKGEQRQNSITEDNYKLWLAHH